MNAPLPAWLTACRLQDIPVLGARRVQRAQGADVAVFRTSDDRVFALLDRCPHKGGPLSQGIVFGDRVACPLHNWSIGLADGQAAAPDHGCTVAFSVRREGDRVMLSAHELATRGLEPFVPAAAACMSKVIAITPVPT